MSAPAKCRASDTLIAAGSDPGLCRALESGEIAVLIKAAGRRGARIVSVCTGAFFLAAAGLLDGRRAATHWRFVEPLRRFRPQVHIDPEAIYLRDGDVWSSAGVTAGIDLALALIEADFGRAIALAVARRHAVALPANLRPSWVREARPLRIDGHDGPLCLGRAERSSPNARQGERRFAAQRA